MKKKNLFLLLFISTSLCAMDEEVKNEFLANRRLTLLQKVFSVDRHQTILHDLCSKVQRDWWEIYDDAIDPSKLEKMKEVGLVPDIYFKAFGEKILEKEGTKIAEKQLGVLRQLKIDQDKINKLINEPSEEPLKKFIVSLKNPFEPFEETLEKINELEKLNELDYE